MFKFIHMADVHFDNIFSTKHKDFREILRNSLYNSFEKTIDICIEKKVNALLIAGDLFESSLMSFKTERFIMKEFKRLDNQGIKVFYTIGNHDVGVNKQVRKLDWPQNVHIFDSDVVETIKIMDENLGREYIISSCGHITSNESRNLVPLFPIKEEGSIHVGLLHTMVTNARLIDNDCYYMPCSSHDLESKNYDYWALGHIHKRQQIGEGAIYYAGNPQGLKSKETGEKGVLYIEIHDTGITEVNFIETSTLRWVDISIDISHVKSNDSLIKTIVKELNGKGITSEVSKRFIPKLRLIGNSVLKHSLSNKEYMEQIKEELLEDFDSPEIIIKIDDLKADYNRLEIERGNHVLGEALGLLKDTEKIKELVNELKYLEFANSEVNTETEKKEYIMTLVDNIDNDIINEFMEVHNEN